MPRSRLASSPLTPVRLRRRRRLAVIGLLVLALLGIGAWLVRGTVDRAADGGGVASPAEVVHVHGLGVNPADGVLYAATHGGLFRITAGGPAERVGTSAQDTMGFTVAGPDRFLGSGHPDLAAFRAGQPGQLGLIESSDAGRSWKRRSLAGDADFHALASAHGQVYGWNSTSATFMVSPDGGVWEVRSQLPLLGFAVDPSNPDALVAAVPGGLRRSGDGGRQWSSPSGPAVVTLSWAPDGVLWGIDADGVVLRSSDGGLEWEATGHVPGDIEAMSVSGDGLWVAASTHGDPTAIFRSVDGRTWEPYYVGDASSR